MPDQWSAWCDFIAATINMHKENNNEDLIKGDQLTLISIFYICLAKNTNSNFFSLKVPYFNTLFRSRGLHQVKPV